MLHYRNFLMIGVLGLSPALAGAQGQRPRAPQPPRAPAPPAAGRPWRDPTATELLNRRRQLDLTPRQVARLDSIERAQYARGRAFADRARQLRDSACGQGVACTAEQRSALRDRVMALRGQQVDTSARRMAMAVLDSTQRGRVQGWQMARGRARMAMATRARARQFAVPGRRGPGVQGRAWRGMDEPRWAPSGPGGMRPGFRPGENGPWMGRGRMGPPPGWDAPIPPRRPRRPGDDAPLPDSSAIEGLRR